LGLGKKLNETIVVCPIRKTGFPIETVDDEVERTVRYLVPNFRSAANQSPGVKEMKAPTAPGSSGRNRLATSFSEMQREQRREEVGTCSRTKRGGGISSSVVAVTIISSSEMMNSIIEEDHEE
jgi:hypothetical protein